MILPRSGRAVFWNVLASFAVSVPASLSVLAGETAGAAASADDAPALRLPAIFGDHMVLQRGRGIAVWGWALPDRPVVAELRQTGGESGPVRAHRRGETRSDAEGRWSLALAETLDAGAPGAARPLPEAGVFDLRVSSGDESLEFRDVRLGDVWLASGQSNMEWQVVSSQGSREAVAAAEYPLLRVFRPAHREAAIEPRDDVQGHWTVCAPETAGRFSAVAFFFARTLLEKHPDVAIGVIDTSWGGLPAQSYTSLETLDSDPLLHGYAAHGRAERNRYAPPTADEVARHRALRTEAEAAYARLRDISHVIPPGGQGLEAPGLDDGGWETMRLPTLWEEADAGLETYDGVVWFRKRLALPGAWAGLDLDLGLGPIDDMDITFANGVEIGRGLQYNEPRHYVIPAAAVPDAGLVLAVRVVDTGGGGGLYAGPMTLRPRVPVPDGAPAELDLEGDWKFLPEPGFTPPPALGRMPGEVNPWIPASLFNAWIAPLIPYSVRGAIWYQGESNANEWRLYHTLFPAMIADWRGRWGYDFPFYWVQLANFMRRGDEPRDTDWARLREAQAAALRLPATGQAVAIDIGEADDIHPRNKADVGLRLAMWALRDVYGDGEVEPRGPAFRQMTVEGAAATLFFDHVGEGLVAGRPGRRTREWTPPADFALAGEDRVFRWARAEITAPDTIVLSAEGIDRPVAARYAWDDNPRATVYGSGGLPMAPFRTDDW